MKGLKNEVRQILLQDEGSRNSDKRLFIMFIRKYYSNYLYSGNYIALNDLLEMPSYDSISRVRRQIQETELKPTREEIKKTRERRQKEVKKDLGYITKEDMHKSLVETANLDKEFKQSILI